MKIYKFNIPLSKYFSIDMPIGSKILSFQEQNGKLCIWALVCTDNSLEERNFSIIGTGHDIDMNIDNIKFIGTVQQSEGILVWHLFEVIDERMDKC